MFKSIAIPDKAIEAHSLIQRLVQENPEEMSDIHITRFVLMGRESSGKTAVLSVIAGVRLGFSDAEVGNRRPVLYQFRKISPQEQATYSIEGKEGGIEDTYKVVEACMKDLQQKQAFSMDELVVTIKSPNVADFNIVDPPGLKVNDETRTTITVPATAAEPARNLQVSVKEAIERILAKYARTDDSCCLVVMEANITESNWANNATMLSLQSVFTNPEYSAHGRPVPNWRDHDSRFCVIQNKMDKLEYGNPVAVHKALENSENLANYVFYMSARPKGSARYDEDSGDQALLGPVLLEADAQGRAEILNALPEEGTLTGEEHDACQKIKQFVAKRYGVKHVTHFLVKTWVEQLRQQSLPMRNALRNKKIDLQQNKHDITTQLAQFQGGKQKILDALADYTRDFVHQFQALVNGESVSNVHYSYLKDQKKNKAVDLNKDPPDDASVEEREAKRRTAIVELEKFEDELSTMQSEFTYSHLDGTTLEQDLDPCQKAWLQWHMFQPIEELLKAFPDNPGSGERSEFGESIRSPQLGWSAFFRLETMIEYSVMAYDPFADSDFPFMQGRERILSDQWLQQIGDDPFTRAYNSAMPVKQGWQRLFTHAKLGLHMLRDTLKHMLDHYHNLVHDYLLKGAKYRGRVSPECEFLDTVKMEFHLHVARFLGNLAEQWECDLDGISDAMGMDDPFLFLMSITRLPFQAMMPQTQPEPQDLLEEGLPVNLPDAKQAAQSSQAQPAPDSSKADPPASPAHTPADTSADKPGNDGGSETGQQTPSSSSQSVRTARLPNKGVHQGTKFAVSLIKDKIQGSLLNAGKQLNYADIVSGGFAQPHAIMRANHGENAKVYLRACVKFYYLFGMRVAAFMLKTKLRSQLRELVARNEGILQVALQRMAASFHSLDEQEVLKMAGFDLEFKTKLEGEDMRLKSAQDQVNRALKALEAVKW